MSIAALRPRSAPSLSFDGWFQQDKIHMTKMFSTRSVEHGNDITVFKQPPQSPDRKPIEHLCSRQICSNCAMPICGAK